MKSDIGLIGLAVMGEKNLVLNIEKMDFPPPSIIALQKK